MRNRGFTKAMPVAALFLGVGGGSYGLASAASGNSTAATSTTPAPAVAAAPPSAGPPWGGRRSDETLLTGDTHAKVKAAALAKVSGVVSTETR